MKLLDNKKININNLFQKIAWIIFFISGSCWILINIGDKYSTSVIFHIYYNFTLIPLFLSLIFLTFNKDEKMSKIINYLKTKNKLIKNVFILCILLISFFQFFIIRLTQTSTIIEEIVNTYLTFQSIIIFIAILCLWAITTNNKKTDQKSNKSKIYYIILGLIIITFIAIKITIPLIYTGSSIDEYNHILSGVEINKSNDLAQFNQASEYVRGIHVSYGESILFKIFGESVFVAKLLPSLLGIINFILIILLLNFIFKKTSQKITLLLIYTFSPWVIFNHFYIRNYIVYETIILITIVSLFFAYRLLKNKKYYLSAFLLAITIFFQSINLLFSNDLGKYYPFLIFVITLLSLLINYAYKRFNFTKIINSIKKYWPHLLLFITIAGILLLLTNTFNDLLYRVTQGQFAYGANDGFRYYNFFFNLNFLFSIFFVTALICLLKFKSIFKKIIIIDSTILAFIYLNLNNELQITRGILYFLPLFYIVSLMIFFKIKSNFNKYQNLLVIIIFILIVVNGFIFNNFFTKGPQIKNEVDYVDYQKSLQFLKENCQNKEIFVLFHNPYIAYFYGLDEVKTAYTDIDFLEKNNKYYKKYDSFYTIHADIPTLVKPNLSTFSKNSCYIFNKEHRNNWRYINNNDKEYIIDNFREKEFIGLSVYY